MTETGSWVDYLLDAERSRSAVAPITDTEPAFDFTAGYQIQDQLVAQRLASGERIVGAKLGLTSRAKQQAMGVHEPVYGRLTDSMVHPADEPLALSELIQPRAEPEIAFLIDDDLAGPGVNLVDVIDATAAVCAALEIIDSRYRDYKFTLPDVVADNTSAARFVLGPEFVRPDFDLRLEGCLFERDGELVDTAAGAAVLGHPAAAVAELANYLGRRDEKLEKGWIVLSGGMTNAVPLGDGTSVSATFARLGRVGVRAVA